jgi:creatinine amidohydrolase
MSGRWIEDLAWPEVGAKLGAGWPVIVPIGARAKEHGHHLPMQTDYLLARALAGGVAAQLPVLVAPVVDFGYYPAFLRYPGSQHLKAETFMALLDDVLDRLLEQGAAHIAIINTGVSTEGPVQIAVRNIFARRGVQIAVADIRRLGKSSARLMQQKLGGHGDEHETSLMLAIAPQTVSRSRKRCSTGRRNMSATRRAGSTTARPACAAIRRSPPPKRAKRSSTTWWRSWSRACGCSAPG